MQSYQLSSYVRKVPDPDTKSALVYHALYGNHRLVNKDGLNFLELFRRPLAIEEATELCDGDPEEIIREFSKLFFLIEPGIDEKRLLKEQKRKHLENVSKGQTIDRMGLAISDYCNFGCTHCIHFQPLTNNGNVLIEYQKPVKQLNMSWEVAKKCIDHYVAVMKRQGHNRGKIHFGNAEPLINWPVIRRVLEYCANITGMAFEFSINTNLVLLTREIAGLLKEYNVRIATSLDGTREANNAIRITKGGQGTFERILAKFDLLADIDYPLDGFSITVTDKNFHLVDVEIINLAAERNMTSIAFDYDLVSLVDIPVNERVDKLICLKRYANERGIDFFGTWDSPFRNITSESLLNGSHGFCAAVQGKAFEFSVDGSIKVCGHTTTVVGHLNRFSEMFHEQGDFAKLVDERFPGTEEYCSGCSIEGSCGGQCHVTREVVSRSIGERRQTLFNDMCNFYRAVTEALALEYLRSNGVASFPNRQSCLP